MNGADAASAEPLRRRPPRPLLALVAVSTALSILPAGFAVHYTAGWWHVRRGKDVAAQRETLLGVTWFKGPFVDFVDRLVRTVPPDARVLVVPSRVETRKGRARWHLYLNHYAYPLRFYTKQPAWASGTLVDYPRWLSHHTRQPSLSVRLDEERAIAERDIEWTLELPVTLRFRADEAVLKRRTDDGAWEVVALAPSRGVARPERDDDDEDASDALRMDSGEAPGLEGGL